MREVLERRFQRLIAEAPRELPSPVAEPEISLAAPEKGDSDRQARSGEGSDATPPETPTRRPPAVDLPLSGEGDAAEADEQDESPWPDLVLIDGGQGQLTAAREVLYSLGVELPLVAIAKGPDRDAGRETFFVPGRDSFKLPPRDPVLYFVERLRDEAHRFAIGSHRARRTRDLREAGLQEIAGIGPARKRALLHHFGTLKAIERAAVTDLMQVDGISAETARRVYAFFHDGAV